MPRIAVLYRTGSLHNATTGATNRILAASKRAAVNAGFPVDAAGCVFGTRLTDTIAVTAACAVGRTADGFFAHTVHALLTLCAAGEGSASGADLCVEAARTAD